MQTCQEVKGQVQKEQREGSPDILPPSHKGTAFSHKLQEREVCEIIPEKI